MRPRSCARSFLYLMICLPTLSACGTSPRSDSSQAAKPRVDLLKNEIPANQLDEVVRAHLQGLGFMERYEYRKAVNAFHEVHERAPGWLPGSINLAIALLNDTGTTAEEQKKKGGGSGQANFDEALALLSDVLTRDPGNLHAHYCRGLILEYLGKIADAHRDFQVVADKDPDDAHVWLRVGSTLTSADNPAMPAGLKDAPKLIELYSKALEKNPYLVTAYFKLQQAYSFAGQRKKQEELLRTWKRLNPRDNPAGPGDTAEAFYGESGKYAWIINPFRPSQGPTEVSPPPRFDAPEAVNVTLADGERWVKADDFTGPLALFGRARARFGATVATFDADGDGRADLFLAAAVKGAKEVRDVLLLNKGDGRFEDVSKAWGLPDHTASLGAAAADFDADRRIDLFLTGPSGYRLLRNDAGKGFVDVTAKAGLDKSRALGLTARWLDLDQDGDLDLYVVNLTDLARAADALGEGAVPPVTNAAFRNDGKPAPVGQRVASNLAPLAVAPPDLAAKEGLSLAFTAWPDADALLGPPANYTSVAALDIDDDRDIDLVLASTGDRPRFVLNDRLGKFHDVPGKAFAAIDTDPIDSLLVTDLDKDGRSDLVGVRRQGGVAASRNATDTSKSPREIAWTSWPILTKTWRTATAADLDLDSWPDLVGLPARGEAPVIEWTENDGQRMINRTLALATAPVEIKPFSGFALADVTGDPLPDLVLLADGMPPQVARNLGSGEHWLALDLGGQWKFSHDHMRTNPHGLGTRITVEGQGLLATYECTTPTAGLAQSVGPVVLGLGKSPSAELVRLRWPDGTMQCELNKTADVKIALTETNRKTGSCPVLFTWNGRRFVCLGDFLGGGGLGYLVAPGVYGQPDRDESVAIAPEQLQAVNGVLRLSVTEPMDEVAYLDRLELVAVDRPPGVSATPDERFAPEGTRPSGEVIAWSTAIEPERATDLTGRDVTSTLRAWDRETVDGFRLLAGWIGYAEEHGIVLDFGDRLSKFGPDDSLVLALAGWVEYPYSQTNYAASTAGVALKPPTVERRNTDGSWTVIEPHAGYPAGLPRMTTLDLTGKLGGPRCVLRLRTNMECYWDQAFIALRDRKAESALRQTTITLSRATLGHRGYTREVSPDGRQPLLYDYDYVDPAPLALMAGRLTRHGDVRPLLLHDDDHLCLVGPGDEVQLEFDAKTLPDLPAGWTRGYVLKAVGYCKDADPFTATSDQVEPLPWRDMPAFPFPFKSNPHRPDNVADRAYLDQYQTRPAGVR
jgi:tetratricopeptide (TPR) repeat protein